MKHGGREGGNDVEGGELPDTAPWRPALTAVTEVLLIGDPRLRRRADEVGDVRDQRFGEEGRRLVGTLEAFRARHGFGRAIAAPQIGISKRFVAVNLGAGPFLVVDPVVTWRSGETFTLWDDCMSFPWLLVRVARNLSISLTFTDEDGGRREWNHLGLGESELMQHELDHLDGVLALDRALDSAGIVSRQVFDEMRETFAEEVDYTIPPLGGR